MPSLPGDTNGNYKHGLSHEGAKHTLYTAYYNMTSRCYNPNNEKYHRYGGRGIIVCDEWKSDKINFFNWSFSNGWQLGLTLDRRENDGNYEPSNCQWIIVGLNSRKKSTTKLTITKAKEIRARHSSGEPVANLAKEFGVSNCNVWSLVNHFHWDETL